MKKVILLFVLPLMCLTLFPDISGAIGFEGFGGNLAFVLPKVGDNTLGFGAVGSLGSILPEMAELKAEVGVEYWGNSQDLFSSSVISLDGTVKYYFPGEGVFPFAGIGLGLIRSSSSYKFFGEDISDSNINLGIDLLGGADFPITPNMKFVAEARYVSTDGHWFQISGGLMLKLY